MPMSLVWGLLSGDSYGASNQMSIFPTSGACMVRHLQSRYMVVSRLEKFSESCSLVVKFTSGSLCLVGL